MRRMRLSNTMAPPHSCVGAHLACGAARQPKGAARPGRRRRGGPGSRSAGGGPARRRRRRRRGASWRAGSGGRWAGGGEWAGGGRRRRSAERERGGGPRRQHARNPGAHLRRLLRKGGLGCIWGRSRPAAMQAPARGRRLQTVWEAAAHCLSGGPNSAQRSQRAVCSASVGRAHPLAFQRGLLEVPCPTPWPAAGEPSRLWGERRRQPAVGQQRRQPVHDLGLRGARAGGQRAVHHSGPHQAHRLPGGSWSVAQGLVGVWASRMVAAFMAAAACHADQKRLGHPGLASAARLNRRRPHRRAPTGLAPLQAGRARHWRAGRAHPAVRGPQRGRGAARAAACRPEGWGSGWAWARQSCMPAQPPTRVKQAGRQEPPS